MTPLQDKAWEKWMEAEYSGLYWQYSAARLGKIVTAVNVISALTGASALTLLIADYPILTKVVALLASALTLFASYSGFQPEYEKAKIRADLYSKLSARYERLLSRINQGLDEESISTHLEVLLDQEALVPTAPDQKYDDKLRERIYKMLIESKGLAGGRDCGLNASRAKMALPASSDRLSLRNLHTQWRFIEICENDPGTTGILP